MSYPGPTRARGSRRTASAASAPASVQSRRGSRSTASTSSYPSAGGGGDTDWERLALFGVGVTLGIAVGAGAALLTTPLTGAETRAALQHRARRLRRTTARRSRDAWEELRDELREARRAFRRRREKRSTDREAVT